MVPDRCRAGQRKHPARLPPPRRPSVHVWQPRGAARARRSLLRRAGPLRRRAAPWRPAAVHRLARRPGRAADGRGRHDDRRPVLRGGRARGGRARAGLAVPLGPAGVQRARRTGTSASEIERAGGEVPAGHAGAHRRLAPPEVRRAAPPRPARARRRVRRRDRPVPQPPRRRRPRAATRSASRWPRYTGRGRRGTTCRSRMRGPAVGDVETVFRERWNDPQPLTRNPVHLVARAAPREDRRRRRCRRSCPTRRRSATTTCSCCGPTRAGSAATRSRPAGERSIAHGYAKALRRARRLIYVEDQYLWSTEVAATFAEALRRAPGAARRRGAAAATPTRTGGSRCRPTWSAGDRALPRCCAAGGDRVAVYGIENHAGTPVYVHAKVCVVDDIWAAVGSDNFNRRSWTHDSELSCGGAGRDP